MISSRALPPLHAKTSGSQQPCSFLASPQCSFTTSGRFSRFFGVYFLNESNVISNKQHHEGPLEKKSKKRGTRTSELKDRMFRPENDARREREVERKCREKSMNESMMIKDITEKMEKTRTK